MPRRIHSAPVPFGPSALCAASATRSAPRALTSRSSHGAAWTASTWNRSPRLARTTLRHLGDRLDRADLVVREHHRHEDRAVGDRPLDLLGVHAAVAVDRDLHDLEAELLQVLERVADRVVLDGRRHDAVSARPAGPGGTLQREVVGLGAAAGEHDLAGIRADRPREPLVGIVERLPGDAAERVRGRRIAEGAAEEGQHRLERLGAQGRGRRMIEIDRHCGRL